MSKDFSIWNEKKTKIENTEKIRVFFHEREVWWCSMGLNVGYEQDGKGDEFARPVLIFVKFNNDICWALPLSTEIKTSKFYASVNLNDGMPRVAILSQLRLIDKKRLINKIDFISTANYMEIQKAVINLCGLQPPSDVV
jgi:mRNA interferase MazF